MAVGEGQGATEDVASLEDTIITDQTGFGASLFRGAVSGYAERKGVASVGGLYPVLKLSGNVCTLIGQHTLSYKRGSMELEAEVELVVEQGRWVQRNRFNGDCIPLRFPWELTDIPSSTHRFDYLDRRSERRRQGSEAKL